ncbi:Uncharacterised protein [Mycobacteroides abscessus subsp. abscessus]|nr:Uncharacterised protein [Mycobacteroides abscessus subsp. abscessus]
MTASACSPGSNWRASMFAPMIMNMMALARSCASS